MKLKDLLKKDNTINEAKYSEKDSKLGHLYAREGIKTKYGKDVVEDYGQDIVDMAIKMAPKVLALKKKIETFVKDIKGTKEAQLLVHKKSAEYGMSGSNEDAAFSNLFDI